VSEVLDVIFSHRADIFRSPDAQFILLAWAVAALGTIVFMRVVGRQIARYSRALAVIAGAAFVPALVLVLAAAAAEMRTDPGDGSGILVFLLVALAVWTLPASLIISSAYVAWHESPRR
jgi:hypothetical protein